MSTETQDPQKQIADLWFAIEWMSRRIDQGQMRTESDAQSWRNMVRYLEARYGKHLV